MPVAVHVREGFLRWLAARRPAVIIVWAVAAALVVNLALWLIALGFDGSFQYVEADGSLHTATAPQGVVTMTVLPMSGGLALAALLAAGKRRTVLRSAQVVGASAALATTAQTFTAGFDTPSTIALSLMHVVIAALVVLALEALACRQRPTGQVRSGLMARPD